MYALHTKSNSCFFKNTDTISGLNTYDTPLSFSAHPYTSLSGSDHNKSHNKPVSGTSVGRIILRIYSKFVNSGDKPPCIQNIFSSITAATGRQLKQSVNVFHNFIL